MIRPSTRLNLWSLRRSLPAACLMAVGTIFSVAPVAAESPLTSVTVTPERFSLTGSRARQQVLVSAQFADGSSGDLTLQATYETAAPSIALVTAQGLVVPRGEGSTEIIVRHGTTTHRVPVEVHDFGFADPIDFSNQAIAALNRAGCNQGACHGSPQGKGGFRLSLRGFDPPFDWNSLLRDEFARRVNVTAPDDSLILRKGLGETPHQGGVRFRKTDSAYQTLRAWIAGGARMRTDSPKLRRLEVFPSQRRLAEHLPRQQLLALAHFADGTTRDVTDLAVYSATDTAAQVSADGLVEFQSTAAASVLVRYLDQIAATQLMYVKRDPAFTFAAPPAANLVDERVFARQRELQLVPAPLADDATFLRRVYLDVIGAIPTAEEAQRFLDSTAPDKRARLIDELLQRPEFASYWAMKWADIMRGSEVTISQRGVHSFHRYLVQQFRDDRPFDQFAKEILTGAGNTIHRPQANFYRIARTPEEAAEGFAQLFLGVRINCARCHNHPFEALTQDDYYGLAAYFARVRYKGKQFMVDDEVVYVARDGEVRHPTRNVNVPPAALGAPAGELTPDDDRREHLAAWLVAPENRYFAASTVNRLWYHLLGRGIVDPVDDLRDTNPPADAALLTDLSAEFARQGYRIRPVLRLILNSSTYQLSAAPPTQSPLAAPAERYFTHAATRMLGAEQTLDAIAAATGVPEAFPGYPLGTRAVDLADGAIDHPFLRAFSKPVRDVTCECAREDDPGVSQAIHMLNNPSIIARVKSPEGNLQRWIAAGKSDPEIVDLMFLATLSRRPTEEDRKLVLAHVAQSADRAAGFQDVQHALLNSNEFLLRH